MPSKKQPLAMNDRVTHRSYPCDPGGTIIGFDVVGGQRCAIVKWDDPKDGTTPTVLGALVLDKPSGFVA